MEKVIDRFSKYLQKELSLNEDQREVVAFGFYMVVSFVFGYAAIAIVGWLLNVFWLAIAVAATGSVLRVVSGGAHSETMLNCTLFGAIVSPGLALIASFIYPFLSGPSLYLLVVAFWAFSLWGVLKYAPADTPQKPITGPAERRRYRTRSLGVLVTWVLVLGSGLIFGKVSGDIFLASTLGLSWQVFSLMPAGYWIAKRFDALIPKSC